MDGELKCAGVLQTAITIATGYSLSLSAMQIHFDTCLTQVCNHTLTSTFQKECVMGISCRVLLWLKEGIKVPERTLDEIVCWHFRETGREKKRRAQNI